MTLVAGIVDDVARLRAVKTTLVSAEAHATHWLGNSAEASGWKTLLGLRAHGASSDAITALDDLATRLPSGPRGDVQRATSELSRIRDGITVLPANPPGSSYPGFRGMSVDPRDVPALFRSADQYLHDALRQLPAS